jgi:large subunit ribosomal protein L30e
MSNIDRELRLALSTGRVYIGSKESIQEMRRGRSKLTILSSNCPEKYKEKIINQGKIGEIPVITHTKDSVDLGTVCGKPYPVSAISINNPGDSKILDITEE